MLPVFVAKGVTRSFICCWYSVLNLIEYPTFNHTGIGAYVSSGSTFIEAGNTLLNDSNDIAIASIAATTISLGSTISAAISAADELTIKEWQGGYDNYAYGIASGGVDASLGTQFETGVGWVGVQTYMAQGTLRIKKEILVSMSGITTGNSPAYPDMN